MSSISNAAQNQLLSEIHKRKDVVLEYLQLAVLDRLTDLQANRMEEIFQQAEADPLLGFLIDEADHIAGHELNLIDSGYIAEQQEKLAQILDGSWIQLIIEKSRLKEYAQLPQKTVKVAQTRLKKRGFYSGEIDGVCGKETKAAFHRLEREFCEELKSLGLLPSAGDEKCVANASEAIELIKAQDKENPADFQEKADLLILQTWLSTRPEFCLESSCEISTHSDSQL